MNIAQRASKILFTRRGTFFVPRFHRRNAMNAYLNRFKPPSTLCKQADAKPAGSRVCTKSAQMQGARRRSNARSVRRGAQRRSWALFVQTLRGGAWRGDLLFCKTFE